MENGTWIGVEDWAGGQAARPGGRGQGRCVQALGCQAKPRGGSEPSSVKVRADWFAVSCVLPWVFVLPWVNTGSLRVSVSSSVRWG